MLSKTAVWDFAKIYWILTAPLRNCDFFLLLNITLRTYFAAWKQKKQTPSLVEKAKIKTAVLES